jgi:hypothetical protein
VHDYEEEKNQKENMIKLEDILFNSVWCGIALE